jgi:hypothetical protein
MSDPFLLGVTYWPRTKGITWWRRSDRGELREEFAQAAALGLNTLRFHLLWEAFQPRLDRLASPAMQAFEQALDVAHEQGLYVVATLFAGALGGALCCPPWLTAESAEVDLAHVAGRGRAASARPPLLTAGGADTRRVVFEDGYRSTTLRDLYEDPLLLEAQRYLLRELVGYFAGHPALYAWELGHQTELLRAPRAAEPFAEWQQRLADLARERGAQRVMAAAGLRGLARRDGPRPESLAELADGLLAVADPPGALRWPERPALEEALLALGLTQAMAPQARILIDDVGMPTAFDGHSGWVADEAYGREQASFFADPEYQGDVLAQRLRELHAGGASGVLLAGLADPRRELWAVPPLRRNLRARTVGLLRPDGGEKPAALAVQRFAEELRGGRLGALRAGRLDLGADLERYARQPGAELQRLMGGLA